MANLKLTTLAVALLGCVFASGCGNQRNQRTEVEIPAGWNLKEPSINVADGVGKAAGAVFPQRIWIKRDSESTYILLEAKGLKEQIKSEMDHVEHFHQAHQASDGDVFLILWFDSDGNPSTGGPVENLSPRGNKLSGFDTRADFYIGAINNNAWSDATLPNRVVNCQFSKWTSI